MTPTQLAFAILGLVTTIALVVSGAAFGFVLNTVREQTRLKTLVEEVLMPQVKLLTALGAHSPDDHHRMDDLLVKWAQGTIDRQRELPELIARAKKVAETSSDDVEKLKAQGLLKMIRAEYQIG